MANILKLLIAGNIDGLGIKYLKGSADIYRVRKGDIRIIYSNTNSDIRLLSIARRNEKTYKRL